MKWVFLAFVLILSACSTIETNTAVIKLKEMTIITKIADTQEARETGLMNFNYLPENEGMLFIFQDLSQYDGFWMKDTLIPLDIIFIDDNKVVDIIEAEPCEKDPCQIYSPEKKTLKVLEVNKGLSRKIGLEIGDEVSLN